VGSTTNQQEDCLLIVEFLPLRFVTRAKGNDVLRIFISGIDNTHGRKHNSIMNWTKILKLFFVPFFCLYFVSFIMLPLVCAIEELDDSCHSNLPYQTNHSPPAAENKRPCPNTHTCCNLITSNTPDYFFVLQSFQLTPHESSPQSLEITTSVFRPPEAKI
jgi:hypothetical protein